MFQKRAIINLNAVAEINQCSIPHEAHRNVCLRESGLSPSTPGWLRELPLLSLRKALHQGWPSTDIGNIRVTAADE